MIEQTASSQDRYRQFLQRVTQTKSVWSLDNGKGIANVDSNQDHRRIVMLFWSDGDQAKRCAAQEWADYEAKEIPLKVFIERWIPGMSTDKTLVGPEWTQQLLGLEVEPQTVVADLKKAINPPPTEAN